MQNLIALATTAVVWK